MKQTFSKEGYLSKIVKSFPYSFDCQKGPKLQIHVGNLVPICRKCTTLWFLHFDALFPLSLFSMFSFFCVLLRIATIILTPTHKKQGRRNLFVWGPFAPSNFGRLFNPIPTGKGKITTTYPSPPLCFE